MSLDDQVKTLEKQVADLFAEQRELVRKIQELAGADLTPRQNFDAKMLAQRIHRDGWGVTGSRRATKSAQRVTK